MLAGRVSSRTTCSCCSWSSAASSIVTMRSSSRDEAREHVQQRRLARAGAARDQHVEPRASRSPSQQLDHLRRQRAELDQVARRAAGRRAKRADREQRAVERERRDDRVDARAVGRRASTIGFDSSTRRPTRETIFSMIRIRCASSLKRADGALEPAVALHVDLRVAVHQDVGDGRVLRAAARAARGRTPRPGSR